jgi:hypothetical protein
MVVHLMMLLVLLFLPLTAIAVALLHHRWIALAAVLPLCIPLIVVLVALLTQLVPVVHGLHTLILLPSNLTMVSM